MAISEKYLYFCVVLSPPTSGVHTSDILTVYISAIKALRDLDPSMVILQVACQPIRKYLRSVLHVARFPLHL
jgi:hypothetical protein